MAPYLKHIYHIYQLVESGKTIIYVHELCCFLYKNADLPPVVYDQNQVLLSIPKNEYKLILITIHEL